MKLYQLFDILLLFTLLLLQTHSHTVVIFLFIQLPRSTSLSILSYSGGVNRFAKVTMTFASSSDVGSVILLVKDSANLTANETDLSTYNHMKANLYNYFDL